MRYLDTFSGVGTATVAWQPLGWECVAHAEIGAFPSAVLAHRFPGVPNWGDCAEHLEWPDEPVDLVCGGTPCQAFSVAGLRAGLADPRGNLTLTYLAIVDQYRPRWFVWENVTGVLSHKRGQTFQAILGAMAQLGYGWAYRVLDAQYVRVDGYARAVPQRRRRLYLVGHLGDWRYPAAVLFEPESLLGDSPPRRQAGQIFGPAPVASLVASGRGTQRIGESRGQDPVVPEIANTLTQRMHKGVNTTMDEGQTMIPVPADDVAPTMQAGGNRTGGDRPYGTTADTAGGLLPVLAFSAKDFLNDVLEDVSPTLRAGGFTTSHQNGGVMPAIAFQERGRPEDRTVEWQEDIAYALTAPDGGGRRQEMNIAQSVSFRGREGGNMAELGDDIAMALRASQGGSDKAHILNNYRVRRLMPVECERLQGLPDDWTNIPWRGKNGAPDGPRYRAIGNGWPVNVVRWIGTRIDAVEAMAREAAE